MGVCGALDIEWVWARHHPPRSQHSVRDSVPLCLRGQEKAHLLAVDRFSVLLGQDDLYDDAGARVSGE